MKIRKKPFTAEVILRNAASASQADRAEVAQWIRHLADEYEKDGWEFGYAFSAGYYVNGSNAREKEDGGEGRDTRPKFPQDTRTNKTQEPWV